MEEENNKKDSFYTYIGSMVFVGCMFIGGGIGTLMDITAAGWQIGMGLGFIALGIIWAYYRNKK